MNYLAIIKFLLGMKFGWLILIGGGIIVGGSLIRNIFTGSFSVGKFLGGFNILAGGVQGKLIYYGLIIFGCFVAYHFIMRPTTSYDTDYKNNIQHNQDVMIDQRVGTNNACNVNLFYGLIKLGCKQDPITKTVIAPPCPVCEKCEDTIQKNNKKKIK
jgi:hypothetical protein